MGRRKSSQTFYFGRNSTKKRKMALVRRHQSRIVYSLRAVTIVTALPLLN